MKFSVSIYFAPEDIRSKIESRNVKKCCKIDDISPSILINSCEVVARCFAIIFDVSKRNLTFPSSLKLATIKAIHKKKERTNRENYRPISILRLF